ncbi:unnamed protein product [Angiostrongylus costaricensis]|uniref:Galectin domain-containing protein n=1 Tax=Angiostrongylus costaricensis TaxID=334426 RepID=A0A0R3PM26_ANGCS|nr:unnamed protein product [Angiostrongylus costaricensis]
MRTILSGMWIVWLLATMNSFVGADETTLGPRSGMAFAQRLVDTLPRLPNVIHSQMEGKPEKLREMISHMLGDGLLSQLVVDPLGVAEGMGVPLNSLGINKTAVEKKFDFYPNSTLSEKLVTGTPTTTEKVMYLDGVPIKDFDQFQQQPTVGQKPITNDNFHNLNVNTLDSRRIQDVDTLLRRAPQKFGEFKTDFSHNMLEGAVGSLPTSFIQSLDPEIDEVVTSLRTGNVMNVERVRQLQSILQTYEQSLQTKELIAKRKQLQLLQSELVEQRRKIEEQKRMEEELRKKEQELEEQRKNMEIQLRQQLHMWHNSFSVPKLKYFAKVIGTSFSEESEEIASSCSCQKISLQKMKGKWLMALASKSLIGKMEVRLKHTLTSKFDEGHLVAQDAPISWEFRTTTSPKLYQVVYFSVHPYYEINIHVELSSNYSVGHCLFICNEHSYLRNRESAQQEFNYLHKKNDKPQAAAKSTGEKCEIFRGR